MTPEKLEELKQRELRAYVEMEHAEKIARRTEEETREAQHHLVGATNLWEILERIIDRDIAADKVAAYNLREAAKTEQKRLSAHIANVKVREIDARICHENLIELWRPLYRERKLAEERTTSAAMEGVKP